MVGEGEGGREGRDDILSRTIQVFYIYMAVIHILMGPQY